MVASKLNLKGFELYVLVFLTTPSYFDVRQTQVSSK